MFSSTDLNLVNITTSDRNNPSGLRDSNVNFLSLVHTLLLQNFLHLFNLYVKCLTFSDLWFAQNMLILWRSQLKLLTLSYKVCRTDPHWCCCYCLCLRSPSFSSFSLELLEAWLQQLPKLPWFHLLKTSLPFSLVLSVHEDLPTLDISHE